ncbi:hypothetical protein Sjap_010692 [Stephania japonica]|uniref:histidine kinase n=1 Tax=Stephania japonica TaxID=461633 RepID=A0AAP0JAX9_9MAGN
MVCEMGEDYLEDMDIEGLPSMWPEDVGNEVGRKFNIEKPGKDQDMLKEVTINEEPTIVDFKRLLELTNYSEKGSSQLQFLVKNWEYKQANAIRLLNEELHILSKQRQEMELKQLEIQEQHRFESEKYAGDKRPISILDDVYDIWEDLPRRKKDVIHQNKRIDVDAEYDSIKYWKQRAMQLDKLLEASVQREQIITEKLQENIKCLEKQSSPVEELSQILKRADNFLHFVLQNAPVVIGHQDIIGKTDVEIFSGAGVKESQDFKKEVMERGLPAKREITFETELFGSKTFLIYVEPVFSKSGDTIGVNYMGMDITDQVIKREKMAKLREEIAVRKAKETELNKTIHITEETMRAKQMLATMSHEIRSPLTGVVSMAEILANTKLDLEQRQLLDVMISSGDLVLQLINDILDLSKVESGVMKLEATKFRPREVVKHVLQTAAASLQKELTLEGHVAEDVPGEVIGDVLRIRQILTNLISNAIKFTHEGKVGINLYVIPDRSSQKEGLHQKNISDPTSGEGLDQNSVADEGPRTPVKSAPSKDETVVWIRCDVYDTGIGIPENAIPTLFKKYMQVRADHARKYGGTGLGLAICKQLVELMGGQLTVSSREHCGSTFTFVLPYKISPKREPSDDSDELSDMDDQEMMSDDDMKASFFHFQPRTLGSLFSSSGSGRTPKLVSKGIGYNPLKKLSNLSQKSYSFPSESCISRATGSVEDECSVTDTAGSEPGSSTRQDLKTEGSSSVVGRKTCLGNSKGQVHNPRTDSFDCGNETDEVCNIKNANKGQDATEMQVDQKPDSRGPVKWPNNNEETKSKQEPKILLVEDNKINVMVTRSMMKQIGHSIDVVNNGVEAVRTVQSHRYDLILMDVCMPVMDGLQATRLIRSYEETGNWDAAMTANALAESADECLANGMDSFVSKPHPFVAEKTLLLVAAATQGSYRNIVGSSSNFKKH